MEGWKRKVSVGDDRNLRNLLNLSQGVRVAGALVHLFGGTGVDGEEAEREFVDERHELEELVRPFHPEPCLHGEPARPHHLAADLHHPAQHVRRPQDAAATSLVADHRERTPAVQVRRLISRRLDPLEAEPERLRILADELGGEEKVGGTEGRKVGGFEFAVLEGIETGVRTDERRDGLGEADLGEDVRKDLAEATKGHAAERSQDQVSCVHACSRSAREVRRSRTVLFLIAWSMA